MHVLIIHAEAQYFGGAETMLQYFLADVRPEDCRVTVAVASGSRVAGVLPPHVQTLHVHDTAHFAPWTVWQTAATVKELHATDRIDVIHGWAARDWELAAAAAWSCGCPVLGTLHDHPESAYISGPRRRLMKWSANFGLDRIVCVSEAVRLACERAGYRRGKLCTVRNGLPVLPGVHRGSQEGGARNCRIGFLGAFAENKGLRDLFRIVAQLALRHPVGWELWMGGDAQGESGAKLMREIETEHGKAHWWNAIQWLGWVRDPAAFFEQVDLLLFPSIQFDSFPTVLLESGRAGIPAVAARIGGVPEIVVDRETGWLFEVGNVRQAAEILGGLVQNPDVLRAAGMRASNRIRTQFSIGKMIADYAGIYSNLTPHV